MKVLILMRHAKSSWKDVNQVDHDRPLNKRGKKDAPRIGRLLRDKRIVPELILTSSARRARDTAEAVADASGYTPEIRHLPSFYQADVETFLDTLCVLPPDVDRVMIVGHNPDLEELIEYLTDENLVLPTAALVKIDVPIQSWSEIAHQAGACKVVQAWYPREID